MENQNKAIQDEYSYPAAFQVAVALAAIEAKESVAEIAQRYGVAVNLVEQWKTQLLDGAVNVFITESPDRLGNKEISRNDLALTIAENSTQGFAMIDEHGYCIYANRAWLEMTGYTAAEISSRPLHDLVHHHYPDGRPYPMTECPIDRALPENFEVRAHEDLFFRKDGSAFSVMCAASPIFKHGRPIATVIEIRDITEKKRIDDELRRVSERQAFQLQMAESLRALAKPNEVMEAASRLIGEHFGVGRVGYGEIDPSETTVSVHDDWTNGAIDSLAGESRPLESFGPSIINELRSGKTLRLDDMASDQRSAPYAAGYASIGVCAMIAVPLIEDDRFTAILYLHDSTPRRWTDEEVLLVEDVARRTWEAVKRARAEEDLRDETRILELLNQTGQIVASTLDMQTLVQSITDTATQLSGAQFGAFFYNTKDEHDDVMTLYTLSGAPREAFERFGHPRATPLFGPTFAGEPPIRSDDVTKDARYGKWAPHHGMPPKHMPVRSYLAVPVVSRSGQAIGGLFFGHSSAGVFSERTERLIVAVAAQAAVAIDNARLYEQAQKAAEERENLLHRERSARSEAERLSRMKDEFLAMLAHELRNPLAPISSAAELLNMLYASEPRVHQTSTIIRRQVAHMTRLVDDLLDVSRVTRDLVTLHKKTLDFRDVIANAISQAQPLIDEKRHRVTLQLPNVPVYVHGDETRLVQAVANILNNAAKYTQEAGNIVLQLDATPSQLELRIKDNGTGIAPELLPDVFELFTQGTRTLARSQGGLGLGLALVKKLVELHGGTVSAYSAGTGHGSEFTIALPSASSIKEETHIINATNNTHQDAKNGQAAALHVMIIDDNLDAANGLAFLLRAKGHRVSVHYTAEVALRQAAVEVPQAFLIDIGLPDMNGYELARLLRALPQVAHSQLIAVTGYGQAQDRERSKAAGFSRHLVKPVDMEALTAILAAIPQSTDVGNAVK